MESWLDYKYRIKRVQIYNRSTKKRSNKYAATKRDDNDLVFAVFKTMSKANSIYSQLCRDFEKTLDRMGMGSREESNKRRLITLHSFRRFVKSTISDLGYSDFSEYFIGHSGSTYYTKTDKQIREIFRKVEPHLTYLDYPTLEQKGADVQAKVEHLENENQQLRHSDQMKEDALATLSDQVMKLMVEVQELKKR